MKLHPFCSVKNSSTSALSVPWLPVSADQLFHLHAAAVEQWKSARTTNAVERLYLEFKRRIKTPTVLPSAETAAMLFWALLASGQIVLGKVDGWMSIARPTCRAN